MIIDHLSNCPLYYPLHPKFESAFDYLRQSGLSGLPVGKVPLEADDLYALVQEYATKPLEAGTWEAHRRYIDLQYIVTGAERIGYASIRHLDQGTYDPARDFLPLQGVGDLVTVPEGFFMLLMPEDAHMPGLAIHAPAPVKKIVLKIAVT
jgi:YhcH/YjgK/YiaL family protein